MCGRGKGRRVEQSRRGTPRVPIDLLMLTNAQLASGTNSRVVVLRKIERVTYSARATITAHAGAR